ncbi:hypothetical protein CLIM01_06838 [Colletotrichum limetticola]|uniref:Uncharacterized protein n=1 Tax=Colletotrichum limetticola TaxID=1209924 RepID=A0ABQ9PW69_9PEZI|nr:hypothetical protein CLIM01_06838 [Colletotrichum limetticola]
MLTISGSRCTWDKSVSSVYSPNGSNRVGNMTWLQNGARRWLNLCRSLTGAVKGKSPMKNTIRESCREVDEMHDYSHWCRLCRQSQAVLSRHGSGGRFLSGVSLPAFTVWRIGFGHCVWSSDRSFVFLLFLNLPFFHFRSLKIGLWGSKDGGEGGEEGLYELD